MRLKAGDRFERYVVKEALDASDRGERYRAVDERLARDVELRLFTGENEAQAKAVAKRLASMAPHRNIVRTYDAHLEAEVPYVVREIVEGKTLREVIAKGRVTAASCLDWSRSIASALAAAHAMDLLHGSLDANAVVLDEDDVARLVDFAAIAAHVESAGTLSLEDLSTAMRTDVEAWGKLTLKMSAASKTREPAIADLMRTAERAAKASSLEMSSMSDILTALGATIRLPRPKNPVPRRMIIAAAIVALGSILTGVAVRAGRSRARQAPPIAATRAESKMSANAQATGAYRAAMQSLRDGAQEAAEASLERATELDDGFAAAHLRHALTADITSASERVHYGTASRLREDLSGHDRTLLDAYEPATRPEPDFEECDRRLQAALAVAPGDADLAYHLARVRLQAGDYVGAGHASDLAIASDPELAGALQIKGYALLSSGDVDGGLAALDACVARSPRATACLGHELDVAVNDGRCADAVALARRLIALDPAEAEWQHYLADALLASGAGDDAVGVALAASWARRSPESRDADTLADRAEYATLSGDLALASDLYEKLDESLAGEPEELAHWLSAEERLALLLERGRYGEATTLAKRYLDQHAAWTPFEVYDSSIVALNALYIARGLPRLAYLARRDVWEKAELSHRRASRAWSPAKGWAYGLGHGIVTKEDAIDALAKLPTALPGPNARDVVIDEAIGHAYLLAGENTLALPFLRRAAGTCSPLYSPDRWLEAHEELGEVLEATGDRAGACEGYALVANAWGDRAKSGRAAVARAKALHCALSRAR